MNNVIPVTSNTVNLIDEVQLRNFTQLDVKIDPSFGIAWVYQRPSPRPCFNPTLVEELRKLQYMLEMNGGHIPFEGKNVRIHYFVLDSTLDGIFSMGGDLGMFRDCVIDKNKEKLHKYANLCIDTIYGFVVGFRQAITTIALVRGDAMGGGFEVALSCNVIIAEKHVGMGFPEILFNIFPGMGGYHLLSQRVPHKQVERMMSNGEKYPAEKLFELGVVDRLVETGCGKEAVYQFIKEYNIHRKGNLALRHVSEKAIDLSHQKLIDVCNYWIEVTMEMSSRDLKMIDRLVRLQDRLMTQLNSKNVAIRNIA